MGQQKFKGHLKEDLPLNKVLFYFNKEEEEVNKEVR
jgi:hypothetical protein